MPQTARYELPPGSDADTFIAALKDRFDIRVGASVTHNLKFLDTFDWRLYRANWCLKRRGKTWTLERAGDAVIKGSVPGSVRFVWDLPQGQLRDCLEDVLEMRALMPRLNMKRLNQPIRILDSREKTVVRVMLDQYHVEPGRDNAAFFAEVTLEGVRGFDRELAGLTTWLEAEGYQQSSQPAWLTGYTLARQTPGDYSSKIKVDLTPDLTAEEALVRILTNLVETMERNVAGVKADIDTEFLHDFRVAIRRTRSALGQLKGVFSADRTKWASEAFSQLGSLTGPLRDLDVYLLERDAYRKLLPERLHRGLDPFMAHLETQRARELKRVVGELKKPQFSALMEQWKAFLRRPRSDSDRGPVADLGVSQLAGSAIWKRYKRIMKLGKKLKITPIDEDLHRLRIHCKKLRYLFEFFTPLMGRDLARNLIRRLKRLQTVLGDFNDLVVQQDTLFAYVSALEKNDAQTNTTRLAIGALIGALFAKQQSVYTDFKKGFEALESAVFEKKLKLAFARPVKRKDAAAKGGGR